MPRIEIYTSRWCPFCIRARRLLDAKGVSYEVHDVDAQPELRAEMERRTRGWTVPQIVIDEQALGGCDELHALDRRGELDPLIHGR